MTQQAKHTPPYDELAAIIEQIEIVALDWKARAEKAESLNADLLATLKLALPYIERVADITPTEMNRQQRQRQACTHAGTVRAAIAKAGGK